MGTNIGKNISKNFSSKYSQKRFDHAKESATDALKTTSKRVIQNRRSIGNKIADRITKVSITSPQNSLRMSMIKKYLSKDLNW